MIRSRDDRRGSGQRRPCGLVADTWMRLGLAVVTWAAMSFILLGYDLFPGRVSLRLRERSPSLVRAPRTAQYVDPEETERLRQEAERRAASSPQYQTLPHAITDAEKGIDSAFAALAASKTDPASRGILRSTYPALSAGVLRWAQSLSQAELEELRRKATDILHQVMSQEIREGTGDLEVARTQGEAAARREESSREAAALLAAVVGREVAPNRRLDREATEAARAEARARVRAVVRTIPADYPVIFPGDRATRQHLAMLEALGLASPPLNYQRVVSIALIVGLLVLIVGAQTRHWALRVYQQPKLLLLLSLLMVIALFTISLVTLALPNACMLLVPATALVAAVLLGDQVGLALAVSLSLLVGLMPNGGLLAALLSLGSAAVGLSYVPHLWPISRLRWIVGAMAAANVALVAASGLSQGHGGTSIARDAALAGLLYSPGAAALSLGAIFLLQRPFAVTTHLGLLELSNPQHPLLRRLQAEAPGTYYASVMVGDLADAAAEVVGADPLLARVGALYHDLGKLRRPAFFVENQGLLGRENIHDRLSSSLSGLVIVSHVKDGVELARQHRLPPEVIEIIEQHHGRALVSYFYQRALSGQRPESVSEDHFRYPGPLPRSKEAGLVMLADSVQAAAKSIAEPTPQRVQQMVREIFRDRMVDGQLADCELTFGDLAAVEATMARILAAVLCHTRIEYPEPASMGTGM